MIRKLISIFYTKKIITDISEKNPYLIRWSFWLPFGYSIKIHKILRPDDDRCPHDHPFWFWRFILKGGYMEQYGEDNKIQWVSPWSLSFCPVDFRHRILELPNGPSWTIGLFGRKDREWGFFTKIRGWVHWEEFVNEAQEKKVLWCDDGTVLNEEKHESGS